MTEQSNKGNSFSLSVPRFGEMHATGEAATELARGGRVGLIGLAITGLVLVGTWAYVQIRSWDRPRAQMSGDGGLSELLFERRTDDSADEPKTSM